MGFCSITYRESEINEHESLGFQELQLETDWGSYIVGADIDLTDGALKEDQAGSLVLINRRVSTTTTR